MKKVFKIVIILLVVAGVIGTFTFIYKKSQPKEVSYEMIDVKRDTIIIKTIATGAVVPKKEIAIKPQIAGIISKIYVEAGDTVKQGDIIAKVKIIPDMVNLNNAKNRIKRAEIDLELSKNNHERNDKLYKKGVISESTYVQTERSFKAAKEELKASKDNLDLIREGVTKSSASQTNTLIRSTITGMVLDVPVKEGNSVIQSNSFNDGTTIALVADMKDMIFEGNIDETEVGRVKIGMPMELTIGAMSKEKYHAIITNIAPKGTNNGGAVQFKIKGAVSLKENQFIRAGYSANASIEVQRKENILSIPESTIFFESDTSYVWTPQEDNKFEYDKKSVELGLSDGINVEVTEGLEEGQQVRGNKK
ncbi:efflux RND transporter periplasmic adaptor subunit [Halosquirtibacter xylanolyticus]|uniref:efflux RND transporter periplasmic adaptor subunit n=1 Tax=Halosquirtibacter xylanolyticus TaxID=3374599 RepID=UPI003748EA92|nr:efflux RND transporter periplasmic adaptor subunit [Prolixibacteraceae bacterium]